MLFPGRGVRKPSLASIIVTWGAARALIYSHGGELGVRIVRSGHSLVPPEVLNLAWTDALGLVLVAVA